MFGQRQAQLSLVPTQAREREIGPPAPSFRVPSQLVSQSGPPLGQYLDIPVTTDWRSTDSVGKLRDIMLSHERGMFVESALFVDEMLTDDRIAGVLDARIAGVLGAPLTFAPADERRKSQKLAHLLDEDGIWLQMLSRDAAKTILKWKIMLGVAVGEIVWNTDGEGPGREWIPRLVPYHPRHLWWNWANRCFQLATAGMDMTRPVDTQQRMANGNAYLIDLPRVDREIRMDSRWFVWGSQYSWMDGAIRSLGMKFIDRQWTERDWARYCEKHGMAIIEGKTPTGVDNDEKTRFVHDLGNLGNEAVVLCPQAPNGMPSYGIELHEASAQTWQTFKARKESLDKDIAIVLLGEHLTVEGTSGSGTLAGNAHENTKLEKQRHDAELFSVVRAQVVVPWADYNFERGKGDRLAPYLEPQIDPPEDEASVANGFKLLGEGLQQLKAASGRVDVDTMLEAAGIPMLEEGDPRAQRLILNPMPPAGPVSPPGETKKLPTSSDARPEDAEDQGSGDEGESEKTEARATLTAELVDPFASAAATLAYLRRGASFKPGTAARRRVARYQDVMAAHAAEQARRAMAPSLEMIREDLAAVARMDDLDNEEKLKELKRRVVRRFPKMPFSALAKLVERLNVYWHLAGRDSVMRGE